MYVNEHAQSVYFYEGNFETLTNKPLNFIHIRQAH